MPRRARLDAPGTLHHVIAGGLEGREIFRDKSDYEGYLSRLARLRLGVTISCISRVMTKKQISLVGETISNKWKN